MTGLTLLPDLCAPWLLVTWRNGTVRVETNAQEFTPSQAGWAALLVGTASEQAECEDAA